MIYTKIANLVKRITSELYVYVEIYFCRKTASNLYIQTEFFGFEELNKCVVSCIWKLERNIYKLDTCPLNFVEESVLFI